MHGTKYLLLAVALVALSSSQSLDVSSCVGPLTAAPNCDFYGSKLSACDMLQEPSAIASCYCPQTVFDALVRCVESKDHLNAGLTGADAKANFEFALHQIISTRILRPLALGYLLSGTPLATQRSLTKSQLRRQLRRRSRLISTT